MYSALALPVPPFTHRMYWVWAFSLYFVFRRFDTVHDMIITLTFSDLHHLITSTLFIRDTQPRHCVPFLKWAVQELDPLFPCYSKFKGKKPIHSGTPSSSPFPPYPHQDHYAHVETVLECLCRGNTKNKMHCWHPLSYVSKQETRNYNIPK